MVLYRALRPDEISRGVPIPKSREPFVAHPMLPLVLPFSLGERPEHAVRAQQQNSKIYPTSGISTTPHLKRAEYYAKKHRTIAIIAVDRLAEFQIQLFRVSEHVHSSLISKPEDDEVILVCPGAECFPKEIVAELFQLSSAAI